MRHGVGDDIDSHRVGILFGEQAEELLIFAFSLRAVDEVIIVTK